MIGQTLTRSNLQSILDAMLKIKEIDRSEYFNNYLQEVIERLKTTVDESENTLETGIND